MPAPVTLKNLRDSFVNSAKPTRNFGGAARLKVGSNDTLRALVYSGKPWPLGTDMVSGILRVYNVETWAGSVTLSVQALTGNWTGARVNWNNQPGVTGPIATKTLVGAAANTAWDIDITDILQAAADGQAWFGLRLTANGATVKNIYSTQEKRGKFRPVVIVEWREPPDIPENLTPDNNLAVSNQKPLLRYEYTDDSGSTDLSQHQIQVAVDEAFTQLEYDSGFVATSLPQFNLDTMTQNKIPASQGNSGTFDSDVNGWLTSNCTLSRVTTPVRDGAGALRMTAIASSTNMFATTNQAVMPVTPGETWHAEGYSRADATVRSTRLDLQWFDSGNVLISSTQGTASNNSTSAWGFREVTGVAPAGAVTMRVRAWTADPVAGEIQYWDTITLNPGTTKYAGLPSDGSSRYWRVKVKDAGGIATDWSNEAITKFVSKGTLNVSDLLGPNGSGDLYVNDSTPTTIWSLTGRTQLAYSVVIWDVNDLTAPIFNTGKITSTNSTVDSGPKALLSTGKKYRRQIRVWDTIDRVQTSSTDTIYYQNTQDFVFQTDATVASPTSLVAALEPPWPWVVLTFNRSAVPDSFAIQRDGVIIEDNIDPGDIFVSGTSYRYVDRLAPPRVQHTWAIIAKVNSKASPPSTGAVLTTRPNFSWLMEPDGSNPVALVKSSTEKAPVVDVTSSTMQEVHQPVGGSSPVLITQFISGYEGRVEAVFADDVVGGLSARTMRNRFKDWKKTPGITLLLYMVDEVLEVVPYNMTYRPRAKSGGQIIYDIGFDFFQVNG